MQEKLASMHELLCPHRVMYAFSDERTFFFLEDQIKELTRPNLGVRKPNIECSIALALTTWPPTLYAACST